LPLALKVVAGVYQLVDSDDWRMEVAFDFFYIQVNLNVILKKVANYLR